MMDEPDNVKHRIDSPAVQAELRRNEGMQVRKSLRKFPHLKHIIKDGFDYAGFCNTVEQSPDLTPDGVTLVKDLFNPNKRIGSAVLRGGKQAMKPSEMLPDSSNILDDHPYITEVWGGYGTIQRADLQKK